MGPNAEFALQTIAAALTNGPIIRDLSEIEHSLARIAHALEAIAGKDPMFRPLDEIAAERNHTR